MNYQRVYLAIVSNPAKNGPIERHHIVPRCMGGGDEDSNLVSLSPKSHFVAHHLLTKIHPESWRLAEAYRLMRYVGDYRVTAREFQRIKEILAPEYRRRGQDLSRRTGADNGRRSKEEGFGVFAIPKEHLPVIGRQGGLASLANKTGIHALSSEQRLEVSKKTGHQAKENGTGIFSVKPEERLLHQKTGGINSQKRGVGIHGLSAEQRTANSLKVKEIRRRNIASSFFSQIMKAGLPADYRPLLAESLEFGFSRFWGEHCEHHPELGGERFVAGNRGCVICRNGFSVCHGL